MPTLRSRLWILLLAHRHLLRGRLRRERITPATPIGPMRERLDASAARFGALPPSVTISAARGAPVAADWLRPQDASGSGAVLYFHGGGYVMGSRLSHRNVVAAFAAVTGRPFLLFDYRLAPEHRYPAALDDALATWRWLLDQGHAADRVAFMGDSAGGGLALATLLAARDRGLPLPAAAVLMSPWTDLREATQQRRHSDPLAPDGAWEVFSSHYAGDQSREDPGLSPLLGDLARLPPLQIVVGGAEVMLDDATRLAERARAAGVDVDLVVEPGMVHGYPAFPALFAEARRAQDQFAAFLRRHLNRPHPAIAHPGRLGTH
jgi:acetyl esterase/lipase